jgi:DNA-binding NarL/FixJ family response regulator
MPISTIVFGRTRLATQLISRALSERHKQFTVVPCDYTLKDFLKQVADHHPAIAVINASLQEDPNAGFRLVREVSAISPDTRAIVLTDCSEAPRVIEAFSAGARGVICGNDPFEQVCKCIQSVHAGQIWANSMELQWIIKALGDREPLRIVSAKGIPVLTKREDQIVRMAVEGMPKAEIATKLGVSEHTVKNHLFRIYEKLGVSNRVELILYALSNKPRAPGPDVLIRQDT